MADKNNDVVSYIQEQLGQMGIRVDTMHVELSNEEREKFGDMDDHEIIRQSYEGREDELLENIMHGITQNIKNDEMGMRANYPDFVTQFMDNPNSKTIETIKKISVQQWKNSFKRCREKIANGESFPATYSEEDLRDVISGLNLVFDFDYSTIKALEVETEVQNINKVLAQKTPVFMKELKIFAQRVEGYRSTFEELQKTTKTIEEFEEKLDEYVKDEDVKYGRTLAEQDKLVFEKKRDLEQTFALYEQKCKKTTELLGKAFVAKQKLDERREKDKHTSMEYYYGELDTFFREECPELELKNMDRVVIILKENKIRFAKLCDKQLTTKQKLKDTNNEVANYIEVSKQEQKASLS